MNARWRWLWASAALFTSLACERDVTIHLLENAGPSDASTDSASPPLACVKVGPEVCNGGDDDCDGVVDDGCAYTITWTRQPTGIPLGHATGGVAFLAPCADGSVLTGLLVGMGAWLNQVVAVCRQIDLRVEGTQSPSQGSVTLGARHDSSFAPATSTDPNNRVQDLQCPDGLVLTGMDGATTTDEARYIHGLRITCAPPVLIGPATAPVLAFDPGRAQTVGPIACTGCAVTQTFNESSTVEAGRIGTELFGADGLWVDRVGVGASVAIVAPR